MSQPVHSETADIVSQLESLKAKLGDVERGVVESAADRLRQLDELIAEMRQQLRWLQGKPFRSKSEAVPAGQLAFDLMKVMLERAEASREQAAAAVGEQQPETNADSDRASGGRGKRAGKRSRDVAQLPVDVREVRLPEAARQCEHCQQAMQEIGWEVSRRYEYVPATVRIREEHLYKYACKRCAVGVVTAETPAPKPVPGSMASATMLSFLVVGKVLDGMPIERLAKQLVRHGVDLPTSTLHDWFARAATLLTFLWRSARAELLSGELISLDDTPLPTRSRGHPNGIHTGRLWLYLGDHDRVAYCEYSPDWKGTHPQRVLEGFRGRVQNDGYAGINPLFRGEAAPVRVGCNDHCRRKFVDALKQGDKRAGPVVELYQGLYAVERQAAEAGLTTADRLALRQARSLPLWEGLRAEISRLAATGERKSPLGKALVYFTRQEPYLAAFLYDGLLPISNAHVERQLRVVGTFRRNSLFIGAPEAGPRYAVLLTLILNCQLCGANPYEYLTDVINKAADDWPASRVAELLPRAWLEAKQRTEQLSGDGAAIDAA